MKRPRLRPTIVGTLFVLALVGGLAAMGASPARIAMTLVVGALGVGLKIWMSHLIWKGVVPKPSPAMSDIPHIIDIRKKTLEALRALEGTAWKEVRGEAHAQYREIPTWILLYEDSDVRSCHEKFRSIVAPCFERVGDFQFTVAYHVIRGGRMISVDFLNDNAEIDRGYSTGELGESSEEVGPGTPSIFVSRDSKRP